MLHNPRNRQDVTAAQDWIVFNNLMFFALLVTRAERLAAREVRSGSKHSEDMIRCGMLFRTS